MFELQEYLVKSLGKIEEYCINLLFVLESSGEIVGSQEELCLTQSAHTKAMLAICEYFMSFKMGYDAMQTTDLNEMGLWPCSLMGSNDFPSRKLE